MTALILALALTGQSPSYNLIVNPPAPAPVAAAPVAVDYRITEHAQLQAEVRSYRAALDEADTQLRLLQRQVNQVKAEQTAARSRARFASETTQDEAPLRTLPAPTTAAYPAQPILATFQATAPPILASSQFAAAPQVYTMAPQVYAAPMFAPAATFSSFSAAPVTYSSTSYSTYGSAVVTGRRGLFGAGGGGGLRGICVGGRCY